MAADARDDLSVVDAEHRMVTEPQHFDFVGIQPHQPASLKQDSLCRREVERSVLARRHAV
ncbi:hypothetical protein [Streptomyces sp. NRRL F-5630]|uniref:hypothetical protein n=1 Tax=Streptomyces sp. NRRL F-5630 TaxID=1463864 RepID=UPI003EBE56A2